MNKFQKHYVLLKEQLAVNPLNSPLNANTDKEMLRLAIQAEYDAVNLYEQMADKTKNNKIKKTMLSVAREEKVHIGEFRILLQEFDKEQERALSDGAEEVG